MKIPTEKEIIKEVKSLKEDMKAQDFQLGIGGYIEKKFFNRINKILRMLRQPVRRVDLGFLKNNKRK